SPIMMGDEVDDGAKDAANGAAGDVADDAATGDSIASSSDGFTAQVARIHRFSLVKIKSKTVCGVCGNRVGGLFSGKKKIMECDGGAALLRACPLIPNAALRLRRSAPYQVQRHRGLVLSATHSDSNSDGVSPY